MLSGSKIASSATGNGSVGVAGKELSASQQTGVNFLFPAVFLPMNSLNSFLEDLHIL